MQTRRGLVNTVSYIMFIHCLDHDWGVVVHKGFVLGSEVNGCE